jgi:phosphatidylserine/phosphatidylglycerophosphate/cardiolipin synthase-like enzyme
MSAYTFTSPTITRALIAAKKRGVHIQLLADERNNLVEDRSGKARHALNALGEAGVEVRVISAYAIHHDKLIIVDDRHLETGSFNFTTSAATRNSENVLVVWNNPELAAIYLRHWETRWAQGRAYSPDYSQ